MKLIYIFFGAIVFMALPSSANASTGSKLMMNTNQSFAIGFSLSDIFSLFIKDNEEGYWKNDQDFTTYKEQNETYRANNIFFSWLGKDSGNKEYVRDEDKNSDWDYDKDRDSDKEWDRHHEKDHYDDDKWHDDDKWDGNKISSRKVWWRYYCY